jgi:hypothetical protein
VRLVRSLRIYLWKLFSPLWVLFRVFIWLTNILSLDVRNQRVIVVQTLCFSDSAQSTVVHATHSFFTAPLRLSSPLSSAHIIFCLCLKWVHHFQKMTWKPLRLSLHFMSFLYSILFYFLILNCKTSSIFFYCTLSVPLNQCH